MAICQSIFQRFCQRLQAICDDYATVDFDSKEIMNEHGLQSAYALMLYSEHMKTQVLQRPLVGKWLGYGQQLQALHCTMKRDLFIKFFSLFKLQGSAQLRLSDAEAMEVEFYCDKSPFFCVHLEASCREI